MIKEKYETLIKKLIEVTGEGKVVWEKTSSRNEYQAKIGDNAVNIGLFDPEDITNSFIFTPNDCIPKLYYYLTVVNSDGVPVDSETREETDAGFDKLKTLFDEARRKYLKVDETLDDILRNL